MLPLADQALVELAREQRDLVVTEVMAKRATGEADLLAAAGDQQGRIKQGPAFGDLEERWGHGRQQAMRTPVLAGRRRFCLLGFACLPGVVIQLPAIGVADTLAVVCQPLLAPLFEPADPLPTGGWVSPAPSRGKWPVGVLRRMLCRLISGSGVIFPGRHRLLVDQGLLPSTQIQHQQLVCSPCCGSCLGGSRWIRFKLRANERPSFACTLDAQKSYQKPVI